VDDPVVVIRNDSKFALFSSFPEKTFSMLAVSVPIERVL